MNRRRFVHLGAMAGMSGALGCRRTRGVGLVWALGWLPDVEYGNLWVAMERGYLRDEGVRMSYEPGGPNAPQPVVVVAAQQANMGDAEWLPFLDAVLQGNDFVVVAAQFPILPTGLITLPRRPMLKPADLVGGRFLVQGPSERNELDATFRLNKLPLDYKLVPVGFSPEALLQGEGDAYFCYVTNQPTMLENMGLKQGKDFFVTKVYDLGYRVPSSLLFMDREMVTKHRGQVVGFLKAILRAQADNARDASYAARLAVEKYGGDLGLHLKQQVTLNRLQVPLELETGTNIPFWFSDQSIRNMYAIAKITGRENLPPPERLIDRSMLEEAYRAVGGKA
ncbi:ABC transporter substrate-binding protein [Granulicella sibirica]|uniref:Thiamine pyrimidine synthase n=1 Tax=Granulicella sibirica TaxID=2479048 RepID=A0A4Q0T3I0_9BACT|nr:ABC transporter substrate-binding protein [Granulicella sibirica]RXH58275.1 Hydroxymethylpyrimidine ABC transporter, substrate-binding component [Granulicella sibirica]